MLITIKHVLYPCSNLSYQFTLTKIDTPGSPYYRLAIPELNIELSIFASDLFSIISSLSNSFNSPVEVLIPLKF